MCGAKKGGLSLEGVDVAKEAVVQGQVTRDGEPVESAYVRLLGLNAERRAAGAVVDWSRSWSSSFDDAVMARVEALLLSAAATPRGG